MIYYDLIRSNRKTIALYVRNDGKENYIEVRAPLRMPKRDIDRFIASKERWITDRMARLSEQSANRRLFSLDYGVLITYRGKQYPIAQKEGRSAGFDERFYMPPNLQSDQIKHTCVQIYRKLAKRDLTEKSFHYAKLLRVTPSAVRVNGAKTRWGSCSAKKSVNFSWRLILADDEVIDYVVVHELAHLIEMNHSERFWAIVRGVFPDYRERRKRLRELYKRLADEDWD